MDIYNAIALYNLTHPKIKMTYIAKELGLTRQRLNQLIGHGAKIGINKYKEKLKTILPKELYEMINFEENIKNPYKYNTYHKDIFFTDEERKKIKTMPYIVSKKIYDKIMNKMPITELWYYKILKRMLKEEKRLKGLDKIRTNLYQEYSKES